MPSSRNQKINEIKMELAISDLDMARIIDELIDSLVKSGMMPLKTLSDITRAKLERRAYLREELFQLAEKELEENPVTLNEHNCSLCNKCHSTDARQE